MAGVAAASRGSDSGSNNDRLVRIEDDSTSTPSSGVVTTLPPGVSTTSEPGNDNDDTSTSLPDDNTSTSVPDDNTSTSLPDDHTSTSLPDDDAPSTTLPPVTSGERTFTVAGGTVVVNLHDDRSLTLVSVTPSAGFEVDRAEASADEVRVEFEGPDGESRVRVRFDEGRLRVETRDN